MEADLKTELEKLEKAQNQALVQVPYRVGLCYLGCEMTPYDTSMWRGMLWMFSGFVLPNWESNVYRWEISSTLPGETVAFRGEKSTTRVASWFMLPIGIPQVLNGTQPPPMAPPMAKAIFDSLTQARYENAIENMRRTARRRLESGAPLTGTDERLLEEDTSLETLVARAKHPHARVNGLAVLSRIENPEDLADIALHAAVPEIRKEAAQRATGLSEARFAQLVVESADDVVAETFLDRVSDHQLLRDVVQSSDASGQIKWAALEKIKQESVLADIVAHSPDADIRKGAIERIDDPGMLLPSVLKDDAQKNRLAALARIKHPKALAAILRKSGDAKVRLEAVRKITDPAVLKEVVAKDADEAVRLAALDRVDDQDVFRMAAEADSSPAVRLAAVGKLTDPVLLAQIAETGQQEEIRMQAVRKTIESIGNLVDSASLAQIAKNSRHEEIRLAALERISDETVIDEMAQSDPSPRVRGAAAAKTGNQETLARIVRTDSDAGIRLLAVQNLQDRDCLTAIARGDADSDVRIAALEKTGDMETIKAVATSDKSSAARAAAVAKVDDPVLLASIAKQDADAAVRARAAARLEDRKKESTRALGMGAAPGATKTFTLPGGESMEMVWCPAGSFTMGSPYGESGRSDVETQHHVTLTKGFWMAKTEVTRKQWRSVMGTNPPGDGGEDLPAANVSWEDCAEFCLRAGMRLPTEAEWEYACRAGNDGPHAGHVFPNGMAWHAGNSGRVTHPAGQKHANDWGLLDMHGNVAEWCADWYGKYPGGSVTDPAGAETGDFRVVRGGGFGDNIQSCRSASRAWNFPGDRRGDLGFRPIVRQN